MDPLITAAKVKSFFDQAKPENIAALTASLREDHGRFGATVVQALPDLLNAQTSLLAALTQAVSELSPDERRERIAQAAMRIDGAALGHALTELARLLHETHQRDPELIDRLRPTLAEAVRAADFGQLREGAVAWSSYRADALYALLAPALADPVRMANLFSALPDLINRQLRLLADLLVEIDMPPEIIASAVFNALSAIDREQLARALNTAASLINRLREGNLTLGRDEPRFAAVFSNIAADLLDKLDTPAIAAALTALGEDIELMIGVAADLILHDPELTAQLAATGVAWHNATLRATANLLHAVAQMPDEHFQQLVETTAAQWQPTEAAQAINEALGLYIRFARLAPATQRTLLGKLVDGIDSEQIREAWTLTGRAVGDVLRERELTAPARVGQRLNESLIRFNRRMESLDGGLGAYLARVLAQIDAGELRRAATHLFGGLSHALLAGAERAMAVLQPAGAALRRIVGFTLRQWKNKLLRRNDSAKER